MKAIMIILSIFAITFGLTACGGSGGGNSSTEAIAQAFYLSDGECYRSSNNETEPQSRCDNLIYAIENGTCVNENFDEQSLNLCTSNRYFRGSDGCMDRTGRVVESSLCGDSTSTQGLFPLVTCTSKEYILLDDGEQYFVTCDGRTGNGRCSGIRLYDQERGGFVECR